MRILTKFSQTGARAIFIESLLEMWRQTPAS